MAEEETPTEKISPARAATLILLGVAGGAGGDALFSSQTDGTLTNTTIDALIAGLTWGLMDKFVWKQPTSYAVSAAGYIAFGSAVGQTLYHYFKTY